MKMRSLQLGVVAAAAALAAAACGVPHPPGSSANSGPLTPKKPDQPITLTLMDGSGDLNFNKPIYQAFAKAHPELVKSINYVTAPAPDVTGKVKAEARGGHMATSLVLGGTDVLAMGIQANAWIKLLPDYSSSLPDVASLQDDNRQKMQALAQGYGVMNTYSPNGPLVGYNSAQVKDVPTTPQALLDWAKAHPGKFSYATVDNSGPGRTWMMGLPYLLGDSNPMDPVNGWSKTWAYLKELGKYVNSYPASTTVLNKQMGDGTILMTPTTINFDVTQHLQNTWSPDIKVATFQNQVFIGDCHYMLIPQGVSAETLYVDLELIKFLLQPEQQVLTYAGGDTTAAIKGVSPDKAPADGQQVYQKYGRPDFYPQVIDKTTVQPQLPADLLNKAFDIWKREVGSKQ